TVIVAAALAACTAQPEPTLEPTVPPLTRTPAAGPTAGQPGGYPAPNLGTQPPAPTRSAAYPSSGPVWLIRPAGQQCQDPQVADLEAASASLTDAGIEVLAAEETNLAVCEACGCPTSLHFRIQIDASQLEAALMLGWAVE
ncbi:MAG: hypothetical protein ACRDHL_06130, partial [Candidatus Promineifilaceae bacterium]